MNLRHASEAWGLAAAASVVDRVPLSRVQSLAARIARRIFDHGGRSVEIALANLRIAFPEASEAERREIGRESFVHFGWNLIDVLRAQRWSREDYASRLGLEGLEHIEPWNREQRGIIGLSLHLGNFEFISAATALSGIRGAIVARRMSNARIYARIAEQRVRFGHQLIDNKNAVRSVLRALGDGRLVGFLNDQYSRRGSRVFVPLFGARCATSTGVALLALRTGAPVIPVYSVREAPDRHVVRFEPALEFDPSGDRRRDIESLTAGCNAAIEPIIRRYPEQYMWGHRRFRYSPDLDRNPYPARN